MTIRRRPVAVFAALVAGIAGAPTAHAAPPFIGAVWPGGVVRYHDATPSDMGPLVREAARQWNTAGAAVRFVAVPRARADIVVRGRFVSPAAGYGGPAGTAPAGRVRFGYVSLFLPRERPRAALAVVVHEFGHVLGLGHQEGRAPVCSLMWPVLTLQGCPTSSDHERELCRFVVTGDLRVVISRYGRRPAARTAGSAFCLRGTRPMVPVAPIGLAGRAERIGPAGARVTLTWSAWPRAHNQFDRIRRYVGTCAARVPGTGIEVPAVHTARGAVTAEAAPPAGVTLCYEVLSITHNDEGVRSVRFGIPPAVARVDVTLPAAESPPG